MLYHMTSDSTKLVVKVLSSMFIILLLFTHIVLSVIIIPLVLVTCTCLVTALIRQSAKITFPTSGLS
jgi:putative membrane protein